MIKVRQDATNTTGVGSTTSAATSVVANVDPVNSVLPAITAPASSASR